MAHLLLVDDDARITELFALFLRKSGHEVRIAADFDAARACLRERAADLVLSDLDLGAQVGQDELPRLAREGLLPRTLVVSGYLDVESEARLLAIDGVVGTLRKPFGLEALLASITAALARPLLLRRAAGALRDAEPDGEGWVDVEPAPPLRAGRGER